MPEFKSFGEKTKPSSKKAPNGEAATRTYFGAEVIKLSLTGAFVG